MLTLSLKNFTQAKLAVASNLITSALINDGGSVEVWMKGAEGAEDEKLGGGEKLLGVKRRKRGATRQADNA